MRRSCSDSAIVFRQLSSSRTETGADSICVFFLPFHGAAAHGRVSKCWATLLPPEQSGMPLQPGAGPPVEQQRLGRHLPGAFASSALG